MTIADLALIGAAGLATEQTVRTQIGAAPPTPVVPLVTTRF